MEEKLMFADSKGNKLCGVLSDPTLNLDDPMIILCHGFSTSKDNDTNTRLQKIFNDEGFATFRFDFYGHGESDGNFEDITVSEAVDDILDAISFVKNKGYTRIGLVASSFSGISSIIAVSKCSDIFALALKSPVSNGLEMELNNRSKEEIADWKHKGYIMHVTDKGEEKRLNYSYFEDLKDHEGYKAAHKIKIPALIVHGDKDDVVPLDQSKRASKLIKHSEIEIIEGADHKYSKPEDFEKMIQLISRFMIEKCFS